MPTRILADKNEGEMVAFTVGSEAGIEEFNVDRFVAENLNRIALPQERILTKVAKDHRIVPSILEEAENETEKYDLVVMGCTREPLIRRFARDPVPETVARMCTKPLVMVKASGGIQSWIKRWI